MGLATDVDINIRILTELVYRISPSLSLSTAVPVFCYTSAEIVIFCRCVYLSLTNCLSADNPKVVDDFWWMFLKEWDTGLIIIIIIIRAFVRRTMSASELNLRRRNSVAVVH